MRSTALHAQRPVRIPFSAAMKLARERATVLGRPTVITMLTPRPVTTRDLAGLGADTPAPAPDAWGNTNKAISALSSVIGTGTKFYADRQDTKQLQAQADAASRQTEAAQRALNLDKQAQAEAQRAAMLAAANAPRGLPAWVLPVAIGGGLLAALGGYFLLKKKAV